jgi:hypothetical protein
MEPEEILVLTPVEYTGNKYTKYVSGKVNLYNIIHKERLDLGWVNRIKIRGLKPACMYNLYIHGVKIGKFNGSADVDFGHWLDKAKEDAIASYEATQGIIHISEYYSRRVKDDELTLCIFLQVLNEITHDADCKYNFDSVEWKAVNLSNVSEITLICDCCHGITNDTISVTFYKSEYLKL